MQDFITVKITRSELEQMLRLMLNNSATTKSHLLAKVICENIAGTECGLDNLYLAMNGVERTYKYRVGESVLIHKDYCYSWKTDFDKMVETEMMINDHVKAEIVAIHTYRNAAYEVKYKYINKDDGKTIEQSGIHVEESRVILDDSYPLED